ncbi:hypothetical protein [Sphingobium sp. R-21]|uniref:hypothetical protein n=1 Tax=Sphingobium sp. R-21 TaxID=3404056 RepID=UPI003CE937C1
MKVRIIAGRVNQARREYLAQSDKPFTIGAIYRLMTTGDTRGYFRSALDDPTLRLSTGCRNALADFTSGAENTFAGIVQTVTSKLSLWRDPPAGGPRPKTAAAANHKPGAG